MNARLTMVVPCYNEAARFSAEDFAGALEQHPELNLVLVDDGSADQTADILQNFCLAHQQRASFLQLEKNQGKSEAVRQGLLRSLEMDSEVVGYCDADLATPLDLICSMATALASSGDWDVAMGSRVRLLGHQIERQPMRHYLGRVFATVASIALGIEVYDTQCGAKVFRKAPWLAEILRARFESGWAFDVELLSRYLINCKRESRDPKIVEIPLLKWMDVSGSKVRLAAAVSAFYALLVIGYRHRQHLRQL